VSVDPLTQESRQVVGDVVYVRGLDGLLLELLAERSGLEHVQRFPIRNWDSRLG